MVSGQPGLSVLIGAGETSSSGREIFDWVFRRLPVPARVAILETPAGFELNSAQVAGRVADFLRHRLQNYRPQVTIVPARKRDTPFSPEAPQIAEMIPGADLLFMGPGSPTYAVRQLQDSLAWHTMVATHRLGAALVLASAAVVSAGAYALPVYEIYKVGEDLHWQRGLDLFGPYGLNLAFVPHWNNRDGGAELDTSRCYMGRARFERLMAMLPNDVTVVGIDEHTALIFHLESQTCQVRGKGGVTVMRNGDGQRFEPGDAFPVHELGRYRRQEVHAGIPEQVWANVRRLRAQARMNTPLNPDAEVQRLVEDREKARARRDWVTADRLRERIAALGWLIEDTEHGPRLRPADGVAERVELSESELTSARTPR